MYTHCGVSNFALSVSEAIAKPQQSRIIWTIAIVIHAPIKLYYSFELAKFYVDYLYGRVRIILRNELRRQSHCSIVVLHLNYFCVLQNWTQLNDRKSNEYLESKANTWRLLLIVAIFTGVIELCSLIGLTLITSHNVDYFYIHQVGFKIHRYSLNKTRKLVEPIQRLISFIMF